MRLLIEHNGEVHEVLGDIEILDMSHSFPISHVADAIRRIDEKEFNILLNTQDIELLTENLINEKPLDQESPKDVNTNSK